MSKKLVAAAFLAACLFWVGCSDGGSGGSAPASRPGNPPPRSNGGPPPARRGGGNAALFRLPMADGQPVTVRTPAALFFFTTWCGYCKQAMPHINRLAGMGTGRGWRVYGIDVNEGPGQVNGFIQQYQPNFPVLLDQDGTVSRQYGVRGYPTFVLIDENGNITYNGHEVPRGF